MSEGKDWTVELKATAELCCIPADQLQWVDGSVRWVAPETTTYEQAKCGFDALKARGVPTKQGYVANG